MPITFPIIFDLEIIIWPLSQVYSRQSSEIINSFLPLVDGIAWNNCNLEWFKSNQVIGFVTGDVLLKYQISGMLNFSFFWNFTTSEFRLWIPNWNHQFDESRSKSSEKVDVTSSCDYHTFDLSMSSCLKLSHYHYIRSCILGSPEITNDRSF